jgi:sucrose synthase
MGLRTEIGIELLRKKEAVCKENIFSKCGREGSGSPLGQSMSVEASPRFGATRAEPNGHAGKNPCPGFSAGMRIPTMEKAFAEFAAEYPREARGFVYHFLELSKELLLRSEILLEFERFCALQETPGLGDSKLGKVLSRVQEAIVNDDALYLALRPGIARWEYLQLHPEPLESAIIPVEQFLAVKEALVLTPEERRRSVLEIDLRPFETDLPRMERTRSIGRGVQFLNRHLAGRLFGKESRGPELIFDFLRMHQFQGRPLMLNGGIENVDELKAALREALDWLEDEGLEVPLAELQERLVRLGFEPGWGSTAGRIAEMMNLLSDLLEAPDATLLEAFLGRIPMLFNLVILSPHGYFGQSHVLGKPDTGGQVVYILDQVRALEKELHRSLVEQGLEIQPKILVLTRLIPEAEGTRCDQPVERIHGTRAAEIVRIPFREETGEIVPHWISRFKIWPYLEGFANEAEREILGRLGTRPDFIIGNYSDGNLVASMLAQSLGVTQCNIAHALEKTKYLYSDLYWKDHEEAHRFSCQFTADLIAMNTADFIITSTYQEIAGTEQTLGQYESYQSFSMPGLYRVVGGVDPFDPKFNIVSPGADPNIFYSFEDESTAPREVVNEVIDLIEGADREDALGAFEDSEKPLLFAMSRLDRIKNMTGLVEWYGEHPELRDRTNLLLVGGHFRTEDSTDDEEREQIARLHQLIAEHSLQGQVRWILMQSDKVRVGEFYRYVARRRGAFVQPARFEAFGLTVIEAMTSGLPVFATLYGGPPEIIEDGRSGFHIDPNEGADAAAKMCAFFGRCAEDPSHWDAISAGAIQRVEDHYTWKLYAQKTLALSRIYGFWKYMTKIERADIRVYISMFQELMYKRLAAEIPRTGPKS